MNSSRFLRLIGACSILLAILVSISSCKKEEPNDPNPGVPFFIEFTVNGATERYESDMNGYGNGPGRKTFTDDNAWAQSEFTLFGKTSSDPDSLKNSISLEIVKLFNDSPSFNTVFNFWEVGTRNYGMWNPDSTNGSTEGVVFTYTDGTGKVWSSGLLYGPQDSSSFAITAHKTVSDELYNGITEGTFDCVFHDGQNNLLTITNGSFKAHTVQDL